jgi:hypothetical protein
MFVFQQFGMGVWPSVYSIGLLSAPVGNRYPFMLFPLAKNL